MSENKINILHIIDNLNQFGGTPNKLLLICKNMDQTRFQNIIVYFSDKNVNIKEFNNTNTLLFRIDRSLFSSVKTIRYLIKKFNIHILSTHYNRANFIGIFCKLFNEIAWIQNEHGMPRGYKAKSNTISKYIIYLYEKLTHNFKSAYIINSYTVRNELLHDISKKTDKYYIVQNAIDTKKYNVDLNCDISNNKNIIFGSVGGFAGYRDYITILKSCKLLKNKGYKFEYKICGDGPKRHAIEEFILTNKLEDCVKLLGYCSNMPKYYNEIDVYIYPVEISAGVGLGLLEPMFFRKPIISFAEGAIQERIIEDNKTGFNIDLHNHRDLAVKMEFFINNRKCIEEFGHNANMVVRKYYNGNRIARDVERIYIKILKERQ